jgi:2'-5' RNA ligase
MTPPTTERLQMRTFVACELPGALADALTAVRRAAEDRAWRWVPAGNVHLTLKFLGEVEAGLLPELKAALERAALQVRPFEIELAELGVLPGGRRPPRVLYAAVATGGAGLASLHQAVEAELVPLGFTADRRRFTPHATLARVRRGRPRELPRLLERFAGESFGRWDCAALTLFESRMGRGPARYVPLAEVPLGGAS